MVDLMHCLTNLLFSDISLLYYTSLNSSIISCLSFSDMYRFLVVALFSFTSVSSFGNSLLDFFDCNSVETLVILPAILLPIKSHVASAVS